MPYVGGADPTPPPYKAAAEGPRISSKNRRKSAQNPPGPLDFSPCACYNSKADVKKNTLHGLHKQQRGRGHGRQAAEKPCLLRPAGLLRSGPDGHYDEDLSLAEIAENLGITRQGVRDAIKHGEAALDELEQKLGNARRHTRMQADLDRLRLLVTEIRCSNSGSFTPDPRITNDTAEMLTILHRLDTQEDADGL